MKVIFSHLFCARRMLMAEMVTEVDCNWADGVIFKKITEAL